MKGVVCWTTLKKSNFFVITHLVLLKRNILIIPNLSITVLALFNFAVVFEKATENLVFGGDIIIYYTFIPPC